MEPVTAIGSLLVMALFWGFGLLTFAFWLWMLVECIRRKDMGDTQKIVWILVLIFVSCIGSIVYFFASDRGNRRYT